MTSRFMPWLAGLLFMAALLPTLNTTRLVEVDELIYARVAQEAALQGHWMPLTWGGKPWVEKPPLFIWLAAITAKASGQPLESWPYRLWCCLGAALCVAALLRLGQLAGSRMSGIFAALLFGLQGDVIFHARFYSMDLALIACGLWAGIAVAQEGYVRAGLIMAVAVWIKSWFVLAFFPALGFAIWRSDEVRRWRALLLTLGLPVLSLAAVTLLYHYAYGPEFLRLEFIGNLVDRFRGLVNERVENNLSFYGKWVMRTAAALTPLAIAAPVFVLFKSRSKASASSDFIAMLGLSWLAALCLMKAQVINYLLPLEAALCLCWGLLLFTDAWVLSGFSLLLLSLLSLLSARRHISVEWSLGLSAVAALWLLMARRVREAPGCVARLGAWFVAGITLVFLLHSAFQYLRHPDDPSKEMAELLLANPARVDAETLNLVGENTQAIAFYSRYNVKPLASLPARRPVEATLVKTKTGWVFYPALK